MPKVSQDHRERRRREILDAALKCFARHGYHQTTMDAIVAESGLSKGAIYQYFEGKEDVFRALRRLQLEELRQRLERAFTGGGGMRERLERGAKEFLSTLKAEYGDLGRVELEFWSEAPRRPDLRNDYREVYVTWQAFLSQVISEGVRTGEFRSDLDPNALASVILAICDGLTLHWVIHRDVVDPEEVSSAFLSGLFQGVTPRPVPASERAAP